MKIIVFSDSHGKNSAMRRSFSANAENLTAAVFLGDGVDDASEVFADFPQVPNYIVSGNREQYFASFLGADIPPYEAFFELGGIKFLALHGHRPHDVKSGLGAMAEYAYHRNADVVLYGHTHEKSDRLVTVAEKKIRFINPGSIGASYDPSYALLTLDQGVLLCGFGEIS